MNIEEYLINMNFNFAHYKGFQYWKEALIYCKGKDFVKIEDIYVYIAEKYNTTRDAVEAAMRSCAIKAKDTVKVRYKKKYNITNKILLNLLRIRIGEFVDEYRRIS